MSNGLALMADKESWSIWDHITGECIRGRHVGKQLAVWPIALTTVEAALAAYPELTVSFSQVNGFKALLLKMVHRKKINAQLPRFFLWPFQRTMAQPVDPRLDKLTQGLGVIVGRQGKFYPMSLLPKGDVIEDRWLGRPLRLERGLLDGVPRAVWRDTGESPMQLLTRWYGFSFTYPDCAIYENS